MTISCIWYVGWPQSINGERETRAYICGECIENEDKALFFPVLPIYPQVQCVRCFRTVEDCRVDEQENKE